MISVISCNIFLIFKFDIWSLLLLLFFDFSFGIKNSLFIILISVLYFLFERVLISFSLSVKKFFIFLFFSFGLFFISIFFSVFAWFSSILLISSFAMAKSFIFSIDIIFFLYSGIVFIFIFIFSVFSSIIFFISLFFSSMIFFISLSFSLMILLILIILLFNSVIFCSKSKIFWSLEIFVVFISFNSWDISWSFFDNFIKISLRRSKFKKNILSKLYSFSSNFSMFFF